MDNKLAKLNVEKAKTEASKYLHISKTVKQFNDSLKAAQKEVQQIRQAIQVNPQTLKQPFNL